MIRVMAYDGPVIDVHTHPFSAMGNKQASPEDLRRLADRAGVVRCGALTIASRGDADRTRKNNDAIVALAAESDGFFYPVCSAHPFDGSAAFEELGRLCELGVRWLKLHPNTQEFDTAAPEVAALVNQAGDLGMTVLFDAYSPWDPAQPGKFYQLALAAPGTRLVLAHMLGMRFAEAMVLAVMRQHYPQLGMNIYFDISVVASMYAGGPYAEHLTWVIRQVGIDRFLFGSDYPLYAPSDALGSVRTLGLSTQEERLVLHDNAAAMLAGE